MTMQLILQAYSIPIFWGKNLVDTRCDIFVSRCLNKSTFISSRIPSSTLPGLYLSSYLNLSQPYLPLTISFPLSLFLLLSPFFSLSLSLFLAKCININTILLIKMIYKKKQTKTRTTIGQRSGVDK